LRQGNAQLAGTIQQTRRQLSVAGSPGAMEEATRKAGFTKPGEQVYVIVKPGNAASAAATSVSASPLPAGNRNGIAQAAGRKDGGVIGAVQQWWRNLWH
jgi:succinylarginine dihydrolase